jgi:hypothetical protein
MRALRLARVAAEAEALRWRRRLRRTVSRAVLGAVGAVFLLAALSFGHVAVFQALRHTLGPTSSALIVFGGDLVIGLVLVLLASVSSPDRVEVEALEVRQRALQQIEEAAATAALVAPVARLVGRPRILAVILALVLPRLIAALRR